MRRAASLARVEPSIDARDGGIELVPEIMLPVQFDDLRRAGVVRCSEHRLMLAVIEDAVDIYQVGCDRDARSRRLFRETEEWFASDDDGPPFSFVTICQVFGLDPDCVRAGLLRWRATRNTSHGTSRAIPFRVRHVSGSRHHVTLSRRRRRLDADEWDQ